MDGKRRRIELPQPVDASLRAAELNLRQLLPGEYAHPSLDCLPLDGKGLGLLVQQDVAAGTLLLRSSAFFIPGAAGRTSVDFHNWVKSLQDARAHFPAHATKLLARTTELEPRSITLADRTSYIRGTSSADSNPADKLCQRDAVDIADFVSGLGELCSKFKGSGFEHSTGGTALLDLLVRANVNMFDGGLCPAVALCNHSCRPNSAVAFHPCAPHELDSSHAVQDEATDAGGSAVRTNLRPTAQDEQVPPISTFEVRALESLQAGSEITISYLEGKLQVRPVSQRQSFLSSHWGFTCSCQRCRLDSSFTNATAYSHKHELGNPGRYKPSYFELGSNETALAEIWLSSVRAEAFLNMPDDESTHELPYLVKVSCVDDGIVKTGQSSNRVSWHHIRQFNTSGRYVLCTQPVANLGINAKHPDSCPIVQVLTKLHRGLIEVDASLKINSNSQICAESADIAVGQRLEHLWAQAKHNLHPRHWVCSALHDRFATYTRRMLLSSPLRNSLRSQDPNTKTAALLRHRQVLLKHIAHLRPLLYVTEGTICAKCDRLVAAVHSRLGAALQVAAIDSQVAIALANADSAVHMALESCRIPSELLEWLLEKRTECTNMDETRVNSQARAHEKKAVEIMEEFYGAPVDDVLYYDHLREQSSF